MLTMLPVQLLFLDIIIIYKANKKKTQKQGIFGLTYMVSEGPNRLFLKEMLWGWTENKKENSNYFLPDGRSLWVFTSTNNETG